MDIIDRAKEMPSSLNDACRTIETMADEIERLRAQLAIAGEHIAEMMDRLASTRKALEGVLDHMDRNGMVNWPVAKRVRKELDALTDEQST